MTEQAPLSHDANPYESPQHGDAVTRPPGRMSDLIKGGCFTAGCGFVGSIVGLTLGAAIGALMPGYYRGVFAGGFEPGFDPVAVGMGQGLTQGIVLGLLVGAVLVVGWWWYNSRRARLAAPVEQGERASSLGTVAH